ncbi:hypothetical protein BCR36DRAFT_412190 [Piromyces finnis]|uniref:Uncharacterized protein n=1 Tax=Piromyces finnis TaxID=1754191 RepID=A0A1Y1V9U5_9FUNG|nr:hypothetical protein BCR36DRAFT_412190 [Piromyces finnis]|eukprot:ORX50693.1 hypothetical protein BCR36DRAFT_412190 [Piromyces finnis]
MGKRTYNNGSHVLNSPPLDPFYIEKDSDYHPNLRHYPDYRRLQYDQYKKEFVPKYFQPVPIKSTYQEDYDIIKNEAENFKDLKSINAAKYEQTRDFDDLIKEKNKVKNSNDDIIIDEEITEDCEEVPLKFPLLSIYDTTYNRMAKVNDYPEIERETRELQKQRKNKNKYNKDKLNSVKLLNKKNKSIYVDESSHFSNIIDDSNVCYPYPNFPAPFSIHPIFHSAKDDFNSTYRVFHNNRKFSIPEPDIYKIKRKIFEDEKDVIDNILKKNNFNIRGSVNVNIYNP